MKTSSNHNLYLLPTPIGRTKENNSLPQYTIDVIQKLDCFIVEKSQTALSFLQWINHPKPFHEITFRVLNKKTPDHEIFSFIKLLENNDAGIMSEAGAPGVADPGARLVKLAHEHNINVIPLVGPSSILLALMASGLNGQSFSFRGYLPIDPYKRQKAIGDLETESKGKNMTQIFMETPHRNMVLFDILLKTLKPLTLLSIACNVTMPDQLIKTKSVYDWKRLSAPDLQKKPALFLILAQ